MGVVYDVTSEKNPIQAGAISSTGIERRPFFVKKGGVGRVRCKGGEIGNDDVMCFIVIHNLEC